MQSAAEISALLEISAALIFSRVNLRNLMKITFRQIYLMEIILIIIPKVMIHKHCRIYLMVIILKIVQTVILEMFLPIFHREKITLLRVRGTFPKKTGLSKTREWL